MSSKPPDAEPRAEHPDELILAGWSEGRLLEFEREAVEAHLADCRACRELVAALEPAATARTRVPWRAVLVAAAVLAFVLLLLVRQRDTAELAPGCELALAGSRAAVFSTMRGAPLETGELFVGVRLDAPGWIRLIAVDESGAAHEVPLDPDGTTSARYGGEANHVFGPYPMELDGGVAVAAILALTSGERIDWTAIEGSAWSGGLDSLNVALFAQALGAQARVQHLR